MKILHLVHAYYPAIGGSEYLMQQVSESLANDSGDDVRVFTTFAYNSGLFTNPRIQPMPEVHREEVLNGVSIRRFPVINGWAKLLYLIQYALYRLRFPGNGFWRMLYYGPISPEMKQAVTEYEADIVVTAPFPLNHMAYGFLNKKKAPVVLVGCMHTADKHGFHNPRIKKLLHKAAGYVALTPHEKDFVVKHYNVSPSKIAVIGVGIDTNIPEDLAGVLSVKEEIQCRSDEAVIAFFGQHGLHKGIKTLIEAMPLVWQKNPKTKLIISGGTTPFTGTFKRLAEEIEEGAGRSQGIYFMDNVDEKRKYNILEACDIFATPSGYESFGITILEAWLKKKPVVACDIQATRNLITDGETGFLTQYKNTQQLANTLNRLLENKQLREKTGQKGYEKLIKNYSREIIGNQYRKFYDKIINQ